MIVGGWLVAVVLAVVVGVVGINLVGSGLTDRQAAPMSEDDVVRDLRALSSSSAAPTPSASAPAASVPAASGPAASGPAPSSSPALSASAPPNGRSFTTQGGLVTADCARILSMAPAQGWSVAEQDDDEGEFRSVDDPSVGLEVDVECVNGQPEITVAPAD